MIVTRVPILAFGYTCRLTSGGQSQTIYAHINYFLSLRRFRNCAEALQRQFCKRNLLSTRTQRPGLFLSFFPAVCEPDAWGLSATTRWTWLIWA